MPRIARDAESVDALAGSLLLRRADGVPSPAILGGTTSLPAIQAFANGLQALERWDLRAADTTFAVAAHLDPTYGRAWLWQAQTKDWERVTPVLVRDLAINAMADSARLSARERALGTALASLGPESTPPRARRMSHCEKPTIAISRRGTGSVGVRVSTTAWSATRTCPRVGPTEVAIIARFSRLPVRSNCCPWRIGGLRAARSSRSRRCCSCVATACGSGSPSPIRRDSPLGRRGRVIRLRSFQFRSRTCSMARKARCPPRTRKRCYTSATSYTTSRKNGSRVSAKCRGSRGARDVARRSWRCDGRGHIIGRSNAIYGRGRTVEARWCRSAASLQVRVS